MVHLAFFDNFTIPSPFPPYNVGSVRSKCPPWSNIVWGGGGGGRAKLGKKSRFYHRTGGDSENIANFQGVPYTFDQDCSFPFRYFLSLGVKGLTSYAPVRVWGDQGLFIWIPVFSWTILCFAAQQYNIVKNMNTKWRYDWIDCMKGGFLLYSGHCTLHSTHGEKVE